MNVVDLLKWVPLGIIALVVLLYYLLSWDAKRQDAPGPPPPTPRPYSDFQAPTSTAPDRPGTGTDIFADHPLGTVESSGAGPLPEEDDLV